MNNTQTYDALLYKIVGAAMTVHSELKYGLLEPVYQEALCMELEQRNVEYCSEETLPIYYKGVLMKKQYRMDIVCGDIVVELKSVELFVSYVKTLLHFFIFYFYPSTITDFCVDNIFSLIYNICILYTATS